MRSHRGETVLALGILSIPASLGFVPLGILAWVLGSRDLKGMKAGRVDPQGLTLTRVGRVCGIIGFVCWVGMAGCVALLSIAGRPIPGTTYISNLDRPGVRTVRTHFENPEHVYSDSNLECEWQEVERNGQWVREGPSVHWSPDHKKLVEGSYREGERDGPWTFWNADGSIEAARSGIYEAGVRVQPGPTPPGDYPVRPPPPRGYTQPR